MTSTERYYIKGDPRLAQAEALLTPGNCFFHFTNTDYDDPNTVVLHMGLNDIVADSLLKKIDNLPC